MTANEMAAEVTAILSGKDGVRHLQLLRKKLTGEDVAWLDALIDVGLNASPKTEEAAAIVDIVVVLLHGMLTEAVWQNLVTAEIEANSAAKVYPVGYGWLDVIRFWLPSWTRQRHEPLEKVLRELRDIQRQHPNSEMVVIAHSFSTYLISKILMEHKDIQPNRLLLCGSIIPLNYRWDQAANTIQLKVVNEVGTRDIWPVLARVTSWGYGCSGTMGFKTNRVKDRYFDWGHSGFFNREHVVNFWLPFVIDGIIVDSPWSHQRLTPNIWLSAAGGFPQIKLTIFLASWAIVACLFWLVQATVKIFDLIF